MPAAPEGLAAETIHAWAKGCAIIDAFDHLLMDQADESGDGVSRAIAKLDVLAPGNFDPDTLASFKAIKGGAEAPAGAANTLIDKLLDEIKGPAAGIRDRRKDQRFPCHLPVVVHRGGNPAGRERPPFEAEFMDISRGGARFMSPERFISGTEIVIEVPAVPGTPRTQPMNLRATVVRCQQNRVVNGFEVAVKFTGP